MPDSMVPNYSTTLPDAGDQVVEESELEGDPLRIRVFALTERASASLRAILMDRITSAISEMSTATLQDVAQFIDICENYDGATSPAEEFIKDLVMHHYNGDSGLTPEDAEHKLKDFSENFADAVRINRRFRRQYASLTGGEKTPHSDIPKWVRETPADYEYQLSMWNNGEGCQNIEITRAEFIQLKQHLAEIRGYGSQAG